MGQILNAKTSLIFGTEVILGWRGYMVITNDYIGICVRPGTAELLIDIEYSKVRIARDSGTTYRHRIF